MARNEDWGLRFSDGFVLACFMAPEFLAEFWGGALDAVEGLGDGGAGLLGYDWEGAVLEARRGSIMFPAWGLGAWVS